MCVRVCRVNPQFAHAFECVQSVLYFLPQVPFHVHTLHLAFQLPRRGPLFFFLQSTTHGGFYFCIFLTRYSCLLVTTTESYKQGELPDTGIDLQHCCCCCLLLLFMLIFFRWLDILHSYSCAFFPPLCFFISFLSPPPLTFHSRQLSLVQLDCFVRAHHLHSD